MKVSDLIKIAIEHEASDLHLKVGNFPILRIFGELRPLTNFPRLTSRMTEEMAGQITTEKQKESLLKNLDIDLGCSLEGYGRFRGSIFHQRGSLAIVLRIIPLEILTIRDLLLPETLEELSTVKRGLILVTGSAGSGKSTTLAALINHININRRAHIITIEDPIEYLHMDRSSIINQREVGIDVLDFSTGLRASLREDPDVIMVGEMRDRDTIETALLAAETGHLVFSTVHTLDAPETINRVVAAMPPFLQRQVRIQMSSILKAIISMRLIPKKDGEGRVPAVELLINTPFIADCVKDKDKLGYIREAIEKGSSQYGMQTFDQSILKLYHSGLISFEQGLAYSSSPDNFKLRAMGVRSTLDVGLKNIENEHDKGNGEDLE